MGPTCKILDDMFKSMLAAYTLRTAYYSRISSPSMLNHDACMKSRPGNCISQMHHSVVPLLLQTRCGRFDLESRV